MQRPLFFILKAAIDGGDTETITRVVAYIRWLDQHESAACPAEVEEDLLGPITDSERLSIGLLSAIGSEEFAQIKKYCVLRWQRAEEKAPKLSRLEQQFKECNRFKGAGSPNAA